MFLSRVALNTNRRETMAALASPHLLHGAIESTIGKSQKQQQRNLWRIDWFESICYLILLSKDHPDLTHIVKQFGYTTKNPQWETKDYNPLLERLKIGDIWRFRLQANPTHSSSREKKEVTDRGKVFAHVTQEQQRQWLMQRAVSRGFSIEEDQFDVVHTEWKRFLKNKNEKHWVTLRIAIYEGILTIQNVDVFRNTLINGIGRGKAYGCGLLTVAQQRRGDNG